MLNIYQIYLAEDSLQSILVNLIQPQTLSITLTITSKLRIVHVRHETHVRDIFQF